MSQFIEMLKSRLENAQQRVTASQQRLQIAQVDHQAVMQEFQSLQTLINVESAREHRETHEQERASATNNRPPVVVRSQIIAPIPVSAPQVAAGEPNKTDMVREILRQHADGLTPAQVWTRAKDQIDRPYVYSVLKRMKDKKEVIARAGKYYLQVAKPREGTIN
jgi:hypothetical protein